MAENQLPVFFRYRFGWHLLFWAAVFLLYWLMGAGITGHYLREFKINLFVLPARMLGTYSFIYLILPLATEKKRFVLFGILTLIHFFIYGFLIYASFYVLNPYPHFYDFSQQPLFNPGKILTKSISDYLIPAMGAVIVIFKKWYLDQQKNKRLAEEKLAAELNFLKAQIHPHFLFNTLNNLYALTLIKSEKTPGIVLKLSDLLDYMIYKSNDKFVPLAKEMEILENYIELEKMRYNERLDFKYEIKGEPGTHEIAPLILLPFVENSFKHGASKDRMNPSIHIRIEIEPAFLFLKVVNSVPAEKKSDVPENEGIGLKNVQRRLELIYPGQHELKIEQGDNLFTVECKILWMK
jgi:two-component system, LytTR family, sensor kinase